jgi:hypothetical protein
LEKLLLAMADVRAGRVEVEVRLHGRDAENADLV